MRRPSARRSKRPEPADPRVQKDTRAAVPARPAASRDARNPPGVSRGTCEAPHSGTCAPGPPSTAGARRSGPLRPSVRRVGCTSTARSAGVSASPRLRAAAGRRRAGGLAGDRGAQWVNVTDDCCWSSALDPQAYRAARGARSGHLLHGSVGEGHVGCFTSDCRRCVTAGARRSGRLESPRMFHVKPWQCSTVGPQVGCDAWDLPDVPDVSRGTRRRCSAAHPRASKPRAHQDGPTAAVPAADARRVGHANRPGRPWAAAAFRCSARRPGMPGCFTWNRRQCPGGRRPSDPDARPVLSHEGTARCSIGACRSGPPGFTWNRAGPQLPLPGRSGCPDGSDVSRGTGGGVGRDGSLRFERPDRMSRRGTAAILQALRSSTRTPTAHQVSGGTAPVLQGRRRRLGRPDGLDVSRGTGSRCLVGRRLQFGRQDRMI